MNEPIWNIAHLGQVEMLAPKLEESTRLLIDIMGKSISDVAGALIYLWAYDDYDYHTLKLHEQPAAWHSIK